MKPFSDTEESAMPCADKIAFDTKKQAQATATTAAYQHGSAVQVYLCKHCELWHLASLYKNKY